VVELVVAQEQHGRAGGHRLGRESSICYERLAAIDSQNDYDSVGLGCVSELRIGLR
jgi:hypothetical protein